MDISILGHPNELFISQTSELYDAIQEDRLPHKRRVILEKQKSSPISRRDEDETKSY
jgi:hypothetical protein